MHEVVTLLTQSLFGFLIGLIIGLGLGYLWGKAERADRHAEHAEQEVEDLKEHLPKCLYTPPEEKEA